MVTSILDKLDDEEKKVIRATSEDQEEILVPRKCAFCKTNVVCSVLPTLIGLTKVGIVVGVEECPYFGPQQTA